VALAVILLQQVNTLAYSVKAPLVFRMAKSGRPDRLSWSIHLANCVAWLPAVRRRYLQAQHAIWSI